MRLQRLVLALGIVAVIWFQIWTISTSSFPVGKLSRHEADYYNLLTEGFLDGHLYLNREVPAELLNAEDPYDPAKRPPSAGMHDVSYYRGHYYLYFGAAPVVCLFIPFKLLTGCALPQAYGNLIFVTLGYVIAALLWLRLRRRYFPQSGIIVGIGGILALGFCAMTLAVLRRPSVWELPIAAGYMFAMACLACCYSGLHAPRNRLGWWIATGLCLGFAIGSRPVYIAGVGLIAIVLWRRARSAWPTLFSALRHWGWWREVAAFAAGLGVPLICVFLYNYFRFGNPLEFGLRYQLTALYEAHVRHFSLTFVPYNFYIYYLAPAHLGRYFPFFQLITPPAKAPEGYYGFEFPYGVLVNMPCLCFAFVAAAAACFGRRTEPILKSFVLANVTFYVGVALFLLGFVTGAQRYMADFTPALCLLAVTGLLIAEAGLARVLNKWRLVLFVLMGGLVGWSALFGAMISFQLHGIYKFVAPASYARVARWFNYPAHYWEKAFEYKPGPLKIRLRFPANRAGAVEPIVATGWEFYSDHLFVYYLDDHHIRIGFEHVSHAASYSDPLEIDFSREHTLIVQMGSLYPPRYHPFYDRLSPMAATSIANWLSVSLDGVTVLRRAQEFYDSAPESVLIGGGHPIEIFGKKFTGEILGVSREPANKWKMPRVIDGPIAMEIYFPDDANGRVEPVLVCGKPGAANALYAKYISPGKLRFGIDSWGYGAVESDVISFNPKRQHTLAIFSPALLGVELPADDARGDSVYLQLDGEPVWHTRIPQRFSGPQPVEFARNSIGLSTCQDAFSGAVFDVRLIGVTKPLPKLAAAMNFALQFFPNNDGAGHADPLFVFGAPPKADIIFLKYETTDIVRFGFDHWSQDATQSPAIQLVPNQPHQVNISISPREHDRADIVIELDGRRAWETTETIYDLTGQSVAIGRNTIGATTCTPSNGGVIFEAAATPVVASGNAK
ncbi:MAG TPA: hypothetical protein VFT72_03355 [Opitutaceae bacterium]|nr:hypothetical protein [Opitutaceae bacterium]